MAQIAQRAAGSGKPLGNGAVLGLGGACGSTAPRKGPPPGQLRKGRTASAGPAPVSKQLSGNSALLRVHIGLCAAACCLVLGSLLSQCTVGVLTQPQRAKGK
jgi:hypothetical protein